MVEAPYEKAAESTPPCLLVAGEVKFRNGCSPPPPPLLQDSQEKGLLHLRSSRSSRYNFTLCRSGKMTKPSVSLVALF